MFKFLRKTSLYILAVPALFFVLGMACNQAVLIANHDTFPVLENEYKVGTSKNITLSDGTVLTDPTHSVMTSRTRLNFLADVVDLGEGIWSIGDGFLALSQWSWQFAPYLYVFSVTNKLRKRKRTQNGRRYDY